MMFCRAAWQRLAPLARKTLSPLSTNAVPIRQMSFGLPASGTNIAYVILGGGSLTAALVYAYKTIISDSARYNGRIAQIEARSKRAVVALTSAEAAAVEETAAAEHITEATAVELVSEVLEVPTNAAEDSPAELEMEIAKTTPAVVEAVTPDAEEPPVPVAEDVAADAAGTMAIPVSDLLSSVRIIAGSTAEIAAASIGDQHLVAAVRLAEEKHSEETLNEMELPDVKVLIQEEVKVSVTEKEMDDHNETMIRRSDAEEGKREEEELEELPSAPEAEVAVTYYDRTEADNPVEVEVAGEDPASLASEEFAGEMDNDLALEVTVSSVVTLAEDAVFFGVAEVTVEEDKTSCHETAVLEDITETTANLEEDLQDTVLAAEFDVTETEMDAVEETQPTEATEKAV